MALPGREGGVWVLAGLAPSSQAEKSLLRHSGQQIQPEKQYWWKRISFFTEFTLYICWFSDKSILRLYANIFKWAHGTPWKGGWRVGVGRSSSIYPISKIHIETLWPANPAGKMILVETFIIFHWIHLVHLLIPWQKYFAIVRKYFCNGNCTSAINKTQHKWQ
jgi:hypothetical protein